MIHVRAGETRDIETIVALQLRLARETEDLDLDRAVVTDGVRAVVEDPAKGRYWLAEEDGKIAGCLLTVPEWSDWRNGTVLWIHSLYVRPESRRRGVFRSLYAHLKGTVEGDESLKGLRLYVNRRNAAAKKVYEAMGLDGRHYEMFEWLA